MKYSSTSVLLVILILIIQQSSLAQDCHCTISEVENNSVIPCTLVIGETVTVTNATELREAIIQANANGGSMTILLEDGTYPIASTSWYPYITASDMVFRSASGNRDAVILTGTGMKDVSPGTEMGIYCVGTNITIADLTIREIGNHGIATHGDSMFVHNVRIQNTYEQMLKGTAAEDGADYGIVQCSMFEYPDGIGPQYYIGGLDIHQGDHWIVRDNVFKNIISPSQFVAEHAIHFWNNSSDNTVERNHIINCDRGIGFGLGSSPSEGGIIRNNMIYNDGSGLFHDVGIGLETSPNTKVYNNTIWIEYPNAIEYRFAETNNCEIVNNLTNKLIRSRDGGQAALMSNYTNANPVWFEDLASGNLRLPNEIPEVTDQGTSLKEDVSADIDKVSRPQGAAYDIGASEYVFPSHTREPKHAAEVSVFPNPAINALTIQADLTIPVDLVICNSMGIPVASFLQLDISNGYVLDVSTWIPGFYFGHLRNSHHNYEVRKIFITH